MPNCLYNLPVLPLTCKVQTTMYPLNVSGTVHMTTRWASLDSEPSAPRVEALVQGRLMTIKGRYMCWGGKMNTVTHTPLQSAVEILRLFEYGLSEAMVRYICTSASKCGAIDPNPTRTRKVIAILVKLSFQYWNLQAVNLPLRYVAPSFSLDGPQPSYNPIHTS